MHVFITMFRILDLVPQSLLNWKDVLEKTLEEVKTEFLIAVKKAIVDFVLGESLHRNFKRDEDTSGRIEIKNLSFKYKHRYNENRRLLKLLLFAISPCLAQVLSLWHTSFENIGFINVEKLAAKEEAYDLSEFCVRSNFLVLSTPVTNFYF